MNAWMRTAIQLVKHAIAASESADTPTVLFIYTSSQVMLVLTQACSFGLEISSAAPAVACTQMHCLPVIFHNIAFAKCRHEWLFDPELLWDGWHSQCILLSSRECQHTLVHAEVQQQ